MDPRGHIYLTEGEVPEEDRERLRRAHAEDAAAVEARMAALAGELDPELRRLREAAADPRALARAQLSG